MDDDTILHTVFFSNSAQRGIAFPVCKVLFPEQRIAEGEPGRYAIFLHQCKHPMRLCISKPARPRPRCSRPVHRRPNRSRTSRKNIPCVHGTAAETHGTVHKIQTVPEDDNMPCRVRAVPLPCVFISVSFSFPAAAFALHPEIFFQYSTVLPGKKSSSS